MIACPSADDALSPPSTPRKRHVRWGEDDAEEGHVEVTLISSPAGSEPSSPLSHAVVPWTPPPSPRTPPSGGPDEREEQCDQQHHFPKLYIGTRQVEVERDGAAAASASQAAADAWGCSPAFLFGELDAEDFSPSSIVDALVSSPEQSRARGARRGRGGGNRPCRRRPESPSLMRNFLSLLSPSSRLGTDEYLSSLELKENWTGRQPLAPMPESSSDVASPLRRGTRRKWSKMGQPAIRHERQEGTDDVAPLLLFPASVASCAGGTNSDAGVLGMGPSTRKALQSNEATAPAAASTSPSAAAPPASSAAAAGAGGSSPGSSDAPKKRPGSPRRQPVTQSLSIPAGAAGAIAAAALQQTHPHAHQAHPHHAPAAAATSASTAHAGGGQLYVGSPASAMKDLPALRDAPPAKREALFIQKLQLCGVIFSFDDPTSDKRGKDMKRQTLLELVDYVNTPAGQKIFTESVMGDLMACVSANVCRALPPATDDFDPEEDEPVLEPAWPHLQVAYEFFLRFIVSSEVNAKAAKKYVDQRFCLQLVELFDSEDPRERDYLKTILHRIYGKFMSHRSFIRRAISNVFYRFVYETERHNGIGELLEILGSIINGFAIPLKKEHLQFLVRALIPLHKPKCVGLYHQQLSYCIIQYVEKDADTATPILNGFFKCWPWSCSGKQVLFLNELEEILELLGADQLAQISKTLFTNLARCLDSDHFQVVERALFLWNNEHLVNSGCLSRLNAQTVLPIIYGPLYKNSSGHWNATVEGLAQNVLKMYMEYDLVLYDKCTAAYFKEEEEAKRKIEAIADRWNAIESLAAANRSRMITAE